MSQLTTTKSSTSSSSTSANQPWKTYAAYAVGGAVALGAVYVGYRYLSKPKASKKKTKSSSTPAPITTTSTSSTTEEKSQSTTVTTPKPVVVTKKKVVVQRMSNEELNTAIEEVLTELSTTGHLDTDDDKNKKILKQIQNFKSGTEGYSSITLLNSMKYLLQWDNALTSSEEAPIHASKPMDDMNMAWDLLSNIKITDQDVAVESEEGSTIAERREDLLKSIHFTQLEIAQRLRDAVRLNAAFLQLTNHAVLGTDDLALSFTVAPVLGRWKDTRNLGDQINQKQPQFLEMIFHQAAGQRSDIPDYSVLYDWSEEESKKGDAALSDLAFQAFSVRGIRKNLESLHTEHIDPTEKQSLKNQLDMDEQKLGSQLIDLPEQTNLLISRHGAFVHMPSLSMLLTVVGPIQNDRMRMRGWLDIREVPGFSPFKQEEAYDLTKGADDIWSGTYTISQTPLEPQQSKRTMRMVFRLQLRLKPVPQP